MDKIYRDIRNPLIRPEDVKPSMPQFKVEGVFNCAAIRYKQEVLLVCRVAESVAEKESGVIRVPVLTEQSGFKEIAIEDFSASDPAFCFDDSRKILDTKTGQTVKLTSLSHFRLVRSRDGIHFAVDEKPWIMPLGSMEEWGIEDPRIVCIDDEYLITYSSVCRHGVTVSLISTKDFVSFDRRGVLLPPSNKDAVLFPKKICGRYIMLHRPAPCEIGNLNIWMAESDNLIDWGRHRLFYEVGQAGAWAASRIGMGAPPLMTERGWLIFYHGMDINHRYSCGLLLLDKNDPLKIIARSKSPVLSPEMDYEKHGFFADVVFPCGIIEIDGGLRIYYGAADDKICAAEMTWSDICQALNA